MRTGSRPSTSSTCTSRTWRTTCPRRLQQLEDGRQRADRDPAVARRAHDARAERPGADGIAMMTSSGSASSRIRASSSVGPRTRTPSMRIPCLSGSSSTKPTGFRPSSGLRRISRRTSRPPSPAPTMSTRRASGERGSRAAALVDGARDEAHAAVEGEESRKNSARTLVGGVTVTSPAPTGTVTGWVTATRPASASVGRRPPARARRGRAGRRSATASARGGRA